MSGRMNLTLTKALSERLEKYCVEVTVKQGRIIPDLKTKITRKALQEWLDEHEKDFDIKTLLKNKNRK